ncbi:hypothetical protein FE783_28905 [Paenibacillus mesophilus]|uniref:heparinase II/III domain-containing protein n=1 Tax=Paenibacillus mesophilus TaxID=2582849 RepID=UPI00110F502C|nr:heparinase II/III family protein [Paenibacillus mesophilus]TMV45524.1 hypothetical protein FE783_28905 [Paenibacillus mesophilus]
MRSRVRYGTGIGLVVCCLMIITGIGLGKGDGGENRGSQTAADVQSYAGLWAVAPKRGQNVTVDGRLLEPVWKSAFQASGFVTMFDNKPVEADTDLYVLYDESNLYIGLEGHRDKTGSEPDTEFVEVLLEPRQDGGAVYRLKIPIATGERPIRTDWGAGVKELTGADIHLSRGSASWKAEAKIPFRMLGVERVSEGEGWRFNVMRYYGVDSLPFSSWVPIRNSYTTDVGDKTVGLVAHALNQARMAPLYFSRPPIAAGVSGNVAVPGHTRLVYRDFQTKQLVLNGSPIPEGMEVQLTWVSPDGKSARLDDVRVETDRASTRITFSHPKPLQFGLYRLQVGFRQADEPGSYFELAFDRDALIDAGNKLAVPPAAAGTRRQVSSSTSSAQVERLMKLIPDKAGFLFTGLPENPSLGPHELYSWSAASPERIVSKTTGTAYPNAKYPETHKLTVKNRLGATVEYPYYEDGNGRKYFFSAHALYFQKDYALRETAKLASADPLGTARLLNRWADAYAGYLPTNDYYWTNYPIEGGAPYPYWGGVWYRWYTGEMINLSYLINAYGDVRKTNAFELLSKELGFDVEKKLEDGLFKPSFDYVRSFPILDHNMEYTTWLGLIRMAKASGQPAYMHEAVERIEQFAANNFLSDGFWKEVTLSYHNQSINGLLQSMTEAKGWSDPAGYVSPRNGRRLDNIDLAAMYPALNGARTMQHVVSYPNGSYVPVQDTWASEKTAQPRTDLGSYLLTGSGISRLTLGSGAEQQQLYLNFVPKYGHNHLDPLNLTVFAKGQELLPDIGYTHTFYRRWAASTLAHNTVVVDGKDMSASGEARHGGTIEAFVAATDTGVGIVKASQNAAYPQTDEYSREPWLIGFGDKPGESGGYVVDIFRVSGGNRHEYTLGGDANRDGVFATDLSMTRYGDYLLPEGTKVRMPESENDTGSADGQYYGYMYVQDVKRAEIPDGRFNVTLETTENGTGKAKLGITGFMDTGGGNELFIGKSPSMRATRLSGTSKDINTEAVKYWLPKLVVRRSGTNLSSTFTTVLEAYEGTGKPRIESVVKLIPDESAEGDVALQIRYGTTTDIILSSAGIGRTLKVGDFELVGKYGLIRIENGAVVKMVLADGKLLRAGGQLITGTGAVTGNVTDVLRTLDGDKVDALVTDADVPVDMAGRYVVVTHPDGKTNGYAVKEIRREGSRTLLVLNNTDPGWDIAADGSSSMTTYPHTGWRGNHTLRIANVIIR